MQLIVAFPGSAEDYVGAEAHRSIGPPSACPNCEAELRLEAHGYYQRWVTCRKAANALRISVRRYLCSSCHLTTSILPDFAQTYRLVASDTVGKFLSGIRAGEEMTSWIPLLDGYRRKFEDRLPETRRVISDLFGLFSLQGSPTEQWDGMSRFFGGVRELTLRLAAHAKITVFGVYRCHAPGRSRRSHTTILSKFPREPPCL